MGKTRKGHSIWQGLVLGHAIYRVGGTGNGKASAFCCNLQTTRDCGICTPQTWLTGAQGGEMCLNRTVSIYVNEAYFDICNIYYVQG